MIETPATPAEKKLTADQKKVIAEANTVLDPHSLAVENIHSNPAIINAVLRNRNLSDETFNFIVNEGSVFSHLPIVRNRFSKLTALQKRRLIMAAAPAFRSKEKELRNAAGVVLKTMAEQTDLPSDFYYLIYCAVAAEENSPLIKLVQNPAVPEEALKEILSTCSVNVLKSAVKNPVLSEDMLLNLLKVEEKGIRNFSVAISAAGHKNFTDELVERVIAEGINEKTAGNLLKGKRDISAKHLQALWSAVGFLGWNEGDETKIVKPEWYVEKFGGQYNLPESRFDDIWLLASEWQKREMLNNPALPAEYVLQAQTLNINGIHTKIARAKSFSNWNKKLQRFVKTSMPELDVENYPNAWLEELANSLIQYDS